MRFRSYDALKVFDVVARRLSFTLAAEELNLSKGAVSYQIRKLEDDLGFQVFSRLKRGIQFTGKGEELWHLSQAAFADLNRGIALLREDGPASITIGMSTYFASRWLSPRLMKFMSAHPGIGLRIQPMIDLHDFAGTSIDMAIRWGKGGWSDTTFELLFLCPATPSASPSTARLIAEIGIEAALPGLTLLQDRQGSEAWRDWFSKAGLTAQPGLGNLVIPDPNVRVQAVIDGQGLALNDALIAAELASGQLTGISDIELDDYGYYLAYPASALGNPDLVEFRDWIVAEAAEYVEP